MQLYEISFTPGVDSKVRAEIQELVEGSTTVEELLTGWPIDEEKSISFYTGLEDDEPELRLIGVEFRRGKKALANAYFTRDEPSRLHPSIVPVVRYQTGYSRHGGIEFDDGAMDKWYDSLGLEYSGALCENIGPRAALLPYLLSFILSDGGEVTVSKADYSTNADFFEDDIEELQAEGIHPNKLLVVFAGYHSLTPVDGVVPGWGTSVYFHAVEEETAVRGETRKNIAL